jgi:hypothetical protein
MTEGYREFLDRVHRADVEAGRAMHKDGDCSICDSARKSDYQGENDAGTNDSG